MITREQYEQLEYERLSPFAAKAAETLGRDLPEEKCGVRSEYQRDRDRIIHSTALRRLMHKTQVFIAPENDHYRTRLTHTLEVAQISRTIARGLALNEDLTEAIAMGHDLGHTPFGHSGEHVLNKIHPGGFHHNVQSLRVVEVLEKSPSGKPLNLTKEVRQGILSHSGKTEPATVEAECVRRADRIAYLNHDLDDALRAGILKPFELPEDCLHILGHSHRERINTMITDIVSRSEDQPHLSMSEPVETAMNGLREFMFDRVYRDGWRDPEEARCDYVLRHLFEYYCEHPGEMPEEFVMIGYRDGTERSVCDFLSCMTDRYATRKFQELFVPSAFPAF